ncbi:MAG: phosphoglucomutase/phosphomannomutase family protein [Candidatus Omnitrophica bacterium]|nr:phosphoglucomutase/phosphomannomutase family protein [Candidatus Omnitrophota bacterium]
MCDAVTKIKFGTDGWRGVISDDFTFANVRRVAQAVSDYYLARNPDKKVSIAIGYDYRFLSDRYARIMAEVFAHNGIHVWVSDQAIPTPTLSFAVKQRGCTAGIMITASHNPGEYNGIKIKTAEGGAAGADVTGEVEKFLDLPAEHRHGPEGSITTVDMTKEYVRFLRSYVDLKKFKNARFRILVDTMHGSGRDFLAQALKGTAIKLEYTRLDHNPSFEGLRPEPIPENLQQTLAKIKKGKYDLCLVLDGDADRIAAITGDGEFISPQKILGLLILHLIQDRKMTGGVVKTLVGTNLIDNVTKKLKLKLFETPVGFKYISELMINDDILVGGEEAGGMGFKEYVPERDGSLAGLLLMEMMVMRKKSITRVLADMEKEFGRYYYLREYITVQALGGFKMESVTSIRQVLDKRVVKVNDIDGVKLILEDGSWLMLRASGTEPIIRIYAESKSLKRTRDMLAFGRNLILKNAV